MRKSAEKLDVEATVTGAFIHQWLEKGGRYKPVQEGGGAKLFHACGNNNRTAEAYWERSKGSG